MNMKEKRFNLTTPFAKAPELDEDKGIAYIEGWASKTYDENGNYVVDYDDEIVMADGLDVTHAKVLLLGHDHSDPIGKIELEKRPQGIFCKAEVHKEMNSKAYYGVKNSIYSQFSIGFIADAWEFKTVDGEDYLTVTKGRVVENSLVAVGANNQANVTAVKSLLNSEKECTGLACSVKTLKEMNPDMDCDCEQEKEQRENMTKKQEGTAQEPEQEAQTEAQSQESEETTDEAVAQEPEQEAEQTSEQEVGQETQTENDDKDNDETASEGTDKNDEQEAEQESEKEDSEQSPDKDDDKVADEGSDEGPETDKPVTVGQIVDFVDTIDLDKMEPEQIARIYEQFTDRIENYVRENS